MIFSFYRVAVLLSVGFVLLGGCRDSRQSSNTTGIGSSHTTGVDALELLPIARQRSEASIRYLPSDDPTGMARAVVVQGFPLVHTRQLMPVDSDGALVGNGSAQQQIEQVLANLKAVLSNAGSGFEKLVRVNIYAESTETVALARQQLSEQIDAEVRPAVTAVVTPLPNPDAMIAIDAVATAAEKGGAVALQRCDAVAGDPAFADAAIMPWGGAVYLSGQVAKGERVRATVKSLTGLWETLNELELETRQIVRLKIFIQPATATDDVLREVKRVFHGQLVPPVVFVEWIASAPVEIEMVVHRPLSGPVPADAVRYFNPASVKNPSPTFSRAAIIDTDRQVYISGLTSTAVGDGEAQVRDLFAQLNQILDETGGDLRHLVKATYYVSDDDASKMLNKLRPDFYDPQRPPAASKATVNGVGQAERTISMDMIAVESGL